MTILIRFSLRILCRIDSSDMEKIPAKGPFIIAVNHINFLEVPMIHSLFYPRKIYGIVKKETWDIFFFRWLANIWDAIPIDRKHVSRETFAAAVEVLNKGQLIAIAPEGTRSNSGALRQGFPGIVVLALLSGVPVLPLVHYGGEDFWKNLKSFRRTRFIVKVGTPFYIKKEMIDSREKRVQAVNQIMYRLASLLPEKYRGIYYDLTQINTQLLEEVPVLS